MDTRPAALMMAPISWLPLAAGILAVQFGVVGFLLRPTRSRFLRSGAALLVADAILVALIRAIAAHMGRMDYSESFFRWRWYFLALILVSVGLPIPLWLGALRLAVGRAGHSSAIHPLFRAALIMWLATCLVTLLMGGEFSYLPRSARLHRIVVAMSGLPADLDGLTIGVLADHHIGPLMTPSRAERRLAALSEANLDLLVDLGDITELDPRYQPAAARVIGEWKARLGSYAVPGNFDMHCGTDTLRKELARVGVTLLENEAARILVGKSELWLIGVGDPWTGAADLDKAMAAVPRGAPAILLAHSPDIIGEAMSRGIPLVLSGHLHGGQVVVPFAGPVVGMSKYGTRFAWGRFGLKGTQLVVSRGLGEEAIPLRLFCPPEIVIVTLRAK
jgi:predicted MPP superfamily phosphohydrolase